mgnify:CR=1 FL=1
MHIFLLATILSTLSTDFHVSNFTMDYSGSDAQTLCNCSQSSCEHLILVNSRFIAIYCRCNRDQLYLFLIVSVCLLSSHRCFPQREGYMDSKTDRLITRSRYLSYQSCKYWYSYVSAQGCYFV